MEICVKKFLILSAAALVTYLGLSETVQAMHPLHYPAVADAGCINPNFGNAECNGAGDRGGARHEDDGDDNGSSSGGSSSGGSSSGGEEPGDDEDGNNGHGNDADGHDSSNPGRSDGVGGGRR